jgi:hypothetical protein
MTDTFERHEGFDDDRLLAYALGLDADPELEAALEDDEELGRRLQAMQADLDDVEVGLGRLVPAPGESYADPAAARWDGLRPSFTPPPEPRSSRGRWRVLVPVLAATLAIAFVGALTLDLGGADEAGTERAASTAESAEDSAGAPGGGESSYGAVTAELALFETGVVAQAGPVVDGRQRFTVVRVLKGTAPAPDEFELEVVDDAVPAETLTLVLLDPVARDDLEAPPSAADGEGEDGVVLGESPSAPLADPAAAAFRAMGFLAFVYQDSQAFARPLPADIDLERLSP